jgi:hypothetical protein
MAPGTAHNTMICTDTGGWSVSCRHAVPASINCVCVNFVEVPQASSKFALFQNASTKHLLVLEMCTAVRAAGAAVGGCRHQTSLYLTQWRRHRSIHSWRFPDQCQ